MLQLWQAVLIDIGSLLVVVANGSSLLLNKSFRESDIPEEPDRIASVHGISYQAPAMDDSNYHQLYDDCDDDNHAHSHHVDKYSHKHCCHGHSHSPV